MTHENDPNRRNQTGPVMRSGPAADDDDLSPIDHLKHWAHKHPVMAGALAGSIIMGGAALGVLGGPAAIFTVNVLPAAVIAGMGAVGGAVAGAVTKSPEVMPSGADPDNLKKMGPIGRLSNWVKRHPRLATAAAGTAILPGVGTLLGWSFAHYLHKDETAQRIFPAFHQGNIEANAKMYEDIAARKRNPSSCRQYLEEATHIRNARRPTF